jgi:dienelactone hydrolase
MSRLLFLAFTLAVTPLAHAEPLPGTQPLEATGDLSAQMVAGIDQWLQRETSHAAEARARTWQAAAQDHPHWDDFAKARRGELQRILGIVDQREPGLIEEVSPAGLVHNDHHAIWSARHVRWPVFPGVYGEGVLFRPPGQPRGVIIIVPDADEIPEHAPHAAELAAQGWLVLAPTLVDRRDNWSGTDAYHRFTNEPHREWIYRQTFELGRTLIGYEPQKVFAAIDALRADGSPLAQPAGHIGVLGHGEGGLIALVSAALDPRIDAVAISGYFGPHDRLYSEPIYRNVFSLLREFGNAELAALTAPHPLFIDPHGFPEISGPPAPTKDHPATAAPGVIAACSADEVAAEKDRANLLLRELGAPEVKVFPGSAEASAALAAALNVSAPPTPSDETTATTHPSFPEPTADFIDARQKRTIHELETFTQGLIAAEERQRTADIWTKLKPGDEWNATYRALHDHLWNDSIGKIDAPYLPPNPRTRFLYETDKFRAYEVMLDVYPDVFAWGWLLVPKDLKPGERRPVVVCQHGLEGVPEDAVTEDPKSPNYHFYKGFASRLAGQGFITYAPHNPYRGKNNFRVLQRRANPLGLSLYSFIIPQHDVTTQWLASLPFVDPQRIAFYGLSYGGKTAMRVPALVDRYCLSICSGDFNEWIRKTVSLDYRGTYVTTPEYEMQEWNLANIANYAEMALLIAPRPFMVERGHEDGVGMDEWVGYEYAKVKRGYDKLGISDRTQIEWFDGPHTINGLGTFEFLHQHLAWPR